MSFTAPRRVLRRHRLTQVGALGAGLALLLTACGGGSEPAESSSSTPAGSSSSSAEATTPSPSGESSPTTSPSGSAGSTAAAGSSGSGGAYVPASAEGPAQNVPKPEMPAVMKEETQEGAEAAVEYWWAALDYMDQTGDSTVFDTVSATDCQFCAYRSNSMNGFYETGGWSTGVESEVHSQIARPSVDGYTSTLLMNFNAGQSYDKTGEALPDTKSEAREKSPWIVSVEFSDEVGYWFVTSAEFHNSDG
ncbi:hypothetical protein HDA33_002064 [Micrococcus endophyticus]|uniref:DUF6318 domain-containing protein n=2 Tax=Micrococcus endophyticus TaxID=455343 RepID=A0A7W9JKC7_9MICC|nr:DUF6318 family protein [Micrococcus endophyticus]MBB5849500.1 hypothetical protein [Micrococcus endophyticus]